MKCELCKKEESEIEYPYYHTNSPFISICKKCKTEVD